MEAASAGLGAGGGLLGALLTWAGFKQRLDRADHDIETLKEDTAKELTELKKAVVYKDTCGVCHAATDKAIDKMDKKLDAILEAIRR